MGSVSLEVAQFLAQGLFAFAGGGQLFAGLAQEPLDVSGLEQVAPGFGAVLHILQFAAGEGTGPGGGVNPDLTLASGVNWSNCNKPSCIYNLGFSGAPQDTNSSPYYDYNTDNLYVGDNAGNIHKFSGVFLGAPQEVTTGWPVAVHAATVLSSPVMDTSSGNILVGDGSGLLSFVVESTHTLGATTIQVGTGGGAIVDAPTVDGTESTVLAVNGTDAAGGTRRANNTSLSAASVSVHIGLTWCGSSTCDTYGLI